MTKDDLKTIEKALAVRLPQSYATLMTSSEAEAARDDYFFRFLFIDPAVVVERTIWLRELMASYGLAFKVSFVVVSEINGGDAVIIDTAGTAEELLFWDHETNVVASFECSLSDFAIPMRN